MISDKSWMDRCRKAAAHEMSVVSFPAVYTWQYVLGLKVDGGENFYVIKSQRDRGYYYPVGEQNTCRNFVLSLTASPGELRLLYVPEHEHDWLMRLGFEIVHEPDTSEYVYPSRSMALLDNGAGKNYRVKVRHFSRQYEWRVRRLVFPEDEPLLMEKTLAWCKDTCHHGPEDGLAFRCAARNTAAIGMSGIYLETKEREWAFLLGYPSTKRIYDMSFIKYSPGISRDVVPVCLCELSKLVCDSFPLINLEDDMGVKGLRIMKNLYHPVFMLNSYTATLRMDREYFASL